MYFQDNNIHNNIALILCSEILKDICAKMNAVYVKALLMLNISKDDSTYIEELLDLCEDIRTVSAETFELVIYFSTLDNAYLFYYVYV